MRLQLLHLYWNEFRKRRKKTTLITFAIAWSSLSLLLLMSFGRGLSNAGSVSFKGLGSTMIMVSRGQTSKPYQGLPRARRIHIHIEDLELLKRQQLRPTTRRGFQGLLRRVLAPDSSTWLS